MAQALDRMRHRRSEKLLEKQQLSIRSQMRLKEEQAAKTPKKRTSDIDPATIWKMKSEPEFEGEPIASLPKNREFWKSVDFHAMSISQLRATVDLLSLDTAGKKTTLAARLEDWVNLPSILARQKEIELHQLKEEKYEASGSVFVFGNNASGQLGLGDREERRKPTEVLALKGKKIIKVFTGYDADYVFALSSTGLMYAWGGGNRAPLGIPAPKKKSNFNSENDIETCLFPQLVKSLRGEDPVAIACARTGGHVIAATEGGQCLTWGEGDYGQLGRDTNLKRSETPEEVTALDDEIIVSISAGNSHTVALADDGRVYSWGGCWGGQLGLGQKKREGIKDKRLQVCFPVPTLLSSIQTIFISSIACGATHTAIISNTGQLYTFGCGDGGRLGLGHNGDVLQPELVESLKKDRVLKVSCGSWHTVCIVAPRVGQNAENAKVGWAYSFGNGLGGQLGLGKQRSALLPTRIPGLVNRKLKCSDIYASSYHNCALAEDGALYTWGRNSYGCLGRFTEERDSFEPDLVDGIKGWGRGPVISVGCGSQFTIVLTAPWKGIRKGTYEDIDILNHKEKSVEKISTRISSNDLGEFDVSSAELQKRFKAEEDLAEKFLRPRRTTADHRCPGFELDGTMPKNVYVCKHCRLPRRSHDIQ